MSDQNSPFIAEKLGEKKGAGQFKLLYALPPLAGSLLPLANQLINAGSLSIFKSGELAGNYVVQMSAECMSNPACVEAVKNPMNLLPILYGFAGGVVVDLVITTVGNMIRGTFSKIE